LHTRICELCTAVIPDEWDNKVHFGLCPECKRPTNYIVENNNKHDKYLVDEVNEKQKKLRLLQQYNVIEYKGKGDIKHINHMRLAKLITEECYKFVTIEDETTGKQEIYYYKDGYYHTGGDNRIREKVDYFIEDDSSIYQRNEVVDAIKNKMTRKRKNFEPPCRYINLKNGVYDVKENKLLKHSHKYYFLNQVPVNYKKESDCPNIKKFFKEVLYPEYVDLIQEMFGFILYRKYLLHKAFLLYGGGRNGKGTTIKIIENFVGYENFSSRKLSQLIEERFSKADLFGKLVNLGAEMSGKALEDTSDFKHLTGGEPITGEKKFHGSFSFVNYAKLIFNANHIPYQKYDKTTAYFKRWIIVPFPETFDESNPKTDPDILDKMISDEELSGLFNWAIIGLKRIIRNRKFSYFDDMEEDEVGERYELLAKPEKRFIIDHLKICEESFIPTNEVYDAYDDWADKRRYPIMTISSFTRSIKKQLYDKETKIRPDVFVTRVDGKSTKCYKNIAWKDKPTNAMKIEKLDVINKPDKKDYPHDKVKHLKEFIEENRKAGYGITLDFLRRNFSDGDINQFIESRILIKRGDGQYEISL